MNRGFRAAIGGVVLAGSLAGLGALSRTSYAVSGEEAVLRLAWRARSVRVDVCRLRTPEELARLPVHMREEEVCEGRLLPYRLRAMVGDEPMVNAMVQPAGARADRPIYVFRELDLEAGQHRVRVWFERQGTDPEQPAETGAEEHEHGPARVAPRLLQLDTTVSLSPRDVLLVTYDEESQRLLARRSTP
jgi:hypothetical protein